ncbi:hypothetical protein [Methylobacterium sp. ID0610]
MPPIRKIASFDGRCSVFVGEAVIFTDLTEAEADAIIRAYRRLLETR